MSNQSIGELRVSVVHTDYGPHGSYLKPLTKTSQEHRFNGDTGYEHAINAYIQAVREANLLPWKMTSCLSRGYLIFWVMSPSSQDVVTVSLHMSLACTDREGLAARLKADLAPHFLVAPLDQIPLSR